MRLAFILLFLLWSHAACAQYKPMSSDPQLRDKYIESCKEKLKEDKKYIKSNYPANSSDIIKTFELRTNQNIAKAKSGEYIIHKETHLYFESLLERIANANPYLDFANIHILLGNSPVPNAYSVGDGTLVINYGIIPHLKNEGQLVFVICHEISHFLLDHSNNKIVSIFQSKESETFKAKLKAIEDSEYNQATQLKKLIRDYLFHSRKFSRQNEYDSDSLGLTLMLNARFPAEPAFETMDILDKLNDFNDTTSVNLDPIFKSVSMVSTDNGSFISEKEMVKPSDDDSFATHPDCSARKNAMQRQSKSQYISSAASANPVDFATLKNNAVYEMCESMMFRKQFDESLLYALRKLQTDSQDLYYKSAVAFSLFHLYQFRKNHTLGYHTPHPHEIKDEQHKKLSNYLYNSRLSSFLKAAYQYNKNLINPENLSDRDLYVLIMLADANNISAESANYRNQLIEKFPNSPYIRETPRKR